MDELSERLKRFGADRDWGKFHKPKDLAVSISIEAAELLEIFQWLPDDSAIDEDMKANIANEVADVLMYLVMLCDNSGIDLLAAANAKIDRNEERFPVETSRGVAKPRKET